jgi:hypothetical protein
MENNMEQEQPLTGEQSLQLITSMINKAKNDYYDTGVSALLWGSVITFCDLVTFANHYLKWDGLDYVWFLTLAAVAPQIIISIREARNRKHRAYEDNFTGGIWLSFAIAIFTFSFIAGVNNLPWQPTFYLVLYGIPTFATGYARRFRPMLIGGVACWILALASTYIPAPYTMLCLAVGGQLAWFIPGLILRHRYLKAKRENV